MGTETNSMGASLRVRSALIAIAISALATFTIMTGIGCWRAASASAATPELFWKTPEDGVAGGEAGRFNTPGGIAADRNTGHLFVADRKNARIDELTAWGDFVKAWGWGVVASGPDNKPAKNERQKLTVSAGAGTYRLVYFNVYRSGDESKQVTVPIGFNWPATDPGTPGVVDSVREALEALPSLKANPGSVSVSGGPGDTGGSTPYEIEFVGALADKDIPPFGVSGSTLSGGSASATVTTEQGGGGFEVCVPANGDVCQAGQPGGNHPGEMPNPNGGLALDTSGNVYLRETLPESEGEGPSIRVQKFSPTGDFLAMWGGEVNKTKSAELGSGEAERNLCTKVQVELGDICGTGVPGSGDGQFEPTFNPDGVIAVGSEGSVFVGDVGRIQKFSSGGAFEGEFKVPGETIGSLGMDSAGNFYAALVGEKGVRELAPSGETLTEVREFPAVNPREVTVDGEGNVYIVEVLTIVGASPQVIAYDKEGKLIIGYEDHFAENGGFHQGLATSEACGLHGPDLFISDNGGVVSAFGPSPLDVEACPPPKVAPLISRQFAVSVGADNATVAARINPRFWSDTRYYVEYGVGQCKSGGCTKTQPLLPGSVLSGQVTNQQLRSAGVLLSGLSPKTTYHYRFVAKSSGGGPVYGIDPDGASPEIADPLAGLEGAFITRPNPSSEPDSCPNVMLRSGVGARLPDCRAYEMVSPVEKENGDIIVLEKPGGEVPMSLNQSSPAGDRLTYSSYRAFGDAQSAPITSTYLASRTSEGWLSEGISPPRGRNTWQTAESLDVQFKAFSPDLCTSWLVDETDPPLSAGAPAGFANLYRRNDCGEGAGSYEALIPVAPETLKPSQFIPELQGVSADGAHALIRVSDKLTENAVPCSGSSNCKRQIYETLPGGGIQAVCILPEGTTAPNGCTAGTASGGVENDGRAHMVHNAISADGSRIFWSDAPTDAGRLYVRIDGTSTQAVSEVGEALSGLAGKGSQYWTAAKDGAVAIFSVGGLTSGQADLYEYRLEGEETRKIAGRVYGLLGASEDAQRIYLVSAEALDAGAVEGKPNLYLYEAGEGGGFSFIASLTKEDAEASLHSPDSVLPLGHFAQVSADGLHVVFMSQAQLTGYENSDVTSGEADAEVFVYDAVSGKLRCVSCNPTGALPSGRRIGPKGHTLLAAAQIPVSQTQLYQAPHVLSSDGGRVFFESFEGLTGADTNGREDVYEWEATGEGGCSETSTSYEQTAEGCVYLISSGQSKDDSPLVDISQEGNDVFFATSSSLLPQDPGLIDIYDARVNGGFAAAPEQSVFCEGEACQGAPSPPTDSTPASVVFGGPGDLVSALTTTSVAPKGKTVSRARAEKLAKALRVCRKARTKRAKRQRCETTALRRYGAKVKSTVKKSNGRGKR